MPRGVTTSVKAILTRDFNWRMGNLRRLEMCAYSLDRDLADQMQELVRMQMDREQFKYEAGLMAIKSGNPGGYMDKWLHKACTEAEHNKRLAH